MVWSDSKQDSSSIERSSGYSFQVIYLELGSVLVVKLRVDIEEMNDTTLSDCCRTTYEGECPYY